MASKGFELVQLANNMVVDATGTITTLDIDPASIVGIPANTSQLPENTNLYYTDEKVDDRVSALIVGGNNITSTYDDTAGTLTIDGQPGYTNSDVGTYLSTNGYDTATNIVASITDSAPGTLDTLNELAAALGDDANFSTTVTNSIAAKLPLSGGALTGPVTTNSTFDGVDIATRDGILTSTTTTADAALPKAGGVMTGELGIGVTPGAWSANYPALQIGQGATFTGHASNTQTQLGQNWWIGTGNQYVVNGTASRLIMNPDSTIIFSQAPSGTAGATISSTDVLVIDSSGRVGIGTNSPSQNQTGSVVPKLHVKATGTTGAYDLVARFEAGTDASTTGASILINHENDRGLLIEAGRANGGDIGVAHFGVTNSGGVNTRAITILATGSTTNNVGIGTVSPTDVFEVSRTSTDQTVGLTLTNQQSGGYGSSIIWRSKRSDNGALAVAGELRVAGENSWNGTGNVCSQMQFATVKDGTLTTHMTLTKNGNLGIGIASPYKKLTLSSAFGGSAEDLLDLQSSTAGGGTAPKIRFGTWANNSNTIGRIGFVDNPNFGGDFVVEANSSGSATDATTEKFRVTKDGSVNMVGLLSFPSSGLAALGSSSKQTIALPNDGGITIGSGYTFANIYGTGGNLHLRANSYIANTGTPSEIILSTASAGGGSSPDVKVKEGYLSSKKGTIQTVINQSTIYSGVNPVGAWNEVNSAHRVSITPRFSTGTKILGTFSIPMNPTGAANILMAINPWYSTDGGTTKTMLNQGGPAGARLTGSHAWFRSSNGYDSNDMQNHIIHFGHTPGATTTLTWGFYFRSEGSNTTYFCYSGSASGVWGWTAPVYMELREVETA